MVWWHAEDVEELQDAYQRLRRTALRPPARAGLVTGGAAPARRSSTRATSRRSWPTRRPRAYVCVYPFVRSYEWYLLEDSERRRLLAEHGQMAREYPDVRANTVASFALGDYEWMLAFEADELHRIVDLMRHLRGSETRRHVREEVPFYTGAPSYARPSWSARCRRRTTCPPSRTTAAAGRQQRRHRGARGDRARLRRRQAGPGHGDRSTATPTRSTDRGVRAASTCSASRKVHREAAGRRAAARTHEVTLEHDTAERTVEVPDDLRRRRSADAGVRASLRRPAPSPTARSTSARSRRPRPEATRERRIAKVVDGLR